MDWEVPLHSDEWLLSLLSTGLALAILASLLLLRASARPQLQLLGTRREQRRLRRLVLPENCVERVESERSENEREENFQSIIHRRDWAVLMEQTRHLGAKARDFYEIISFSRKPEAWWSAHQVNQEKLAGLDLKPVLVFVNTRSGGQQGVKVLREMQAYLHIAQLVDLRSEGPESALRWWEKTNLRYRILVCGGDGTVGWVLGVLEQLGLSYIPPLAILPLGTGNDLAQTFGWGGGYMGGSVLPVLQHVGRAHVELLDRWTVACRSLDDKRPSFLPGGSQQPRERKTLTMSNYFGIGVDAAVALDFHQMRERRPEWFWSQLVNKLWYFRSGAMTWMGKTCANIGSKIDVICDGEAVDIPSSLEGVIILNIPSFGGGTDLWGRAEDENEHESDSDASGASVSSVTWTGPGRQSVQDGLLEVVGVHGALQLGASQVGLYKAQRLAQGSHVKVTNKVALPMEVDGEPSWFAKDGVIEISHRGQAFMLVKSKETSHAVATDVVDWALQQKIINLEQRHRMLKEIAQRAGARKPNSWTRLSPPD